MKQHSHRNRGASRLSLILLAAFCLVQSAVPCWALWGGGANDDEKIGLKVKLDKAAYRPGEVVMATVEVINNTRGALKGVKLNASSVLFVFGRQGDPELVERQAAASEREVLDEAMTLEPGKPVGRTFVLTRLTEFSGPLMVQAHYQPGGEVAAKVGGKFYSNTVNFKVGGARLFKRDPEGYLIKEEAIRLAGAAVKGEVEGAQAIFVRDEAGFYKWYVNVRPRGGAMTAYFVNPYLGRVFPKPAKPFDPQMARDPRFDRPANLPPLKMPTVMPGQTGMPAAPAPAPAAPAGAAK